MERKISYKNIMKKCIKETLKELNEKEITYRVRLVAYQKFAKAIKEA